MRLLSLTVRNFRGFGSAGAPIALDADLILMFGPSGFGKTSLAEAIEWLFYGTTGRRLRGDSYSKNEYDGCFPNAHGGTPVEVSAIVRLANGTEHELTRRIPDPRTDNISETFLDGKPAYFASVGVHALHAAHPVVAQHDLQSLIHSRPKERRDVISGALGLDELTALKTALDGARKSFAATAPPGVEEARAKLRPLAIVLGNIAETKSLAQRWQKAAVEVRADEDLQALIEAGQRLAESPAADIEALLAALRPRRQQLSKNVFDAGKLSPPSDVAATVTRLATETTALTTACTTLAEHLSNVVAAAAATYSTILLQFWETGLNLVPQGNECPMCEEPTLTAGKRAELQARLQAAQKALTGDKQVTTATGTAATALVRARQAVEQAGIGGLGPDDRSLLQRLLADKAETLTAFLAVHDDLMTAANEAHDAGTALREFLTKIPDRLADTGRAVELIAESTAVPKRFTTAAAALEDRLKRYATAWTAFDQVLSAEISSTKAIAEIDAVGKALRAKAEIRTLAAYDAVLSGSRTLMQKTEGYLQTKQTELLDSRGKEIKAMYDQMNPGAQVGFERMEPGNEQLRLHATSFGVRMSAAANLSECQLNCLGLSFWLVRATTAGSPFGFILLDDPVQAMDDDHCEAFIGTVVPSLCDEHKKQVIVLSHERKLIDRIRDLNKGRETLVYHYDDYERAGPSITPQINLAVMLSEVQGLAKGNEANRSSAVDKLRKVGEQFIRDLHLKQAGVPAPAEYDNAQPSVLLELFRTIPGTLPDEHNRLKDTFDFVAPAHHQQAGYIVPSMTNITPHIDRLRTLMKKYKLLP